jgi:hypothetical protein
MATMNDNQGKGQGNKPGTVENSNRDSAKSIDGNPSTSNQSTEKKSSEADSNWSQGNRQDNSKQTNSLNASSGSVGTGIGTELEGEEDVDFEERGQNSDR